jgi:hypothetical protein
MDRAAHGWASPENARELARQFCASSSVGSQWLPPAAMKLLYSLPLDRRRLTKAEAEAVPRGLSAALSRHALTLGCWRGPGWATAVLGRTDPGGAENGDYQFQALRVEADRRRVRARLHALPFVMTGHTLVRFLTRTGRDPETLFGPELLAAARFAVAAALLLGRRGVPDQLPELHYALSFREGALVGTPSLMRGQARGSLPGFEATFSKELRVVEVPNPASLGSDVLPAGVMAVLQASTFLSRNRMGEEQRRVGDRSKQMSGHWARELEDVLAETYLDREVLTAEQTLARHPALFAELEAHLGDGFARLAAAKAEADLRALARGNIIGGCTGSEQQGLSNGD